MSTSHGYSMQQLTEISELPKRTIRYYIQKGLVNRPNGAKKNASYTSVHLEQLLKIKMWKAAGINLERISHLLSHSSSEQETQQPGDVQVVCRIFISPGVYLDINRETSQLTDEDIRAIGRSCLKAIDEVDHGEN